MRYHLIATILCSAALSCNFFFEEPFKNPSDYSGMAKIPAAGKTFFQGWDNPSATVDEKPSTPSSFTYDYWLDTIEVTQGFYSSLMGKSPVPDTSVYGIGDRFPVYNVTWFDAVMFCNARSKSENLDTVYSYTLIDSLPNGSVINLAGMSCDVSRDGYRLPTEAEWEFAARDTRSSTHFSANPADSAVIDFLAWYAINAGDQTHPVGEKQKNDYGLYDIFGNVFEWTNDWKGFLDGKTISNSLGAYQPNSEFEKVIKGGAFCFNRIFLRPSYRSATYATLLSSAVYYVGFRCARGGITNGCFRGSLPDGGITNPVEAIADAAKIRSFLRASACKIALVNVQQTGRTLCCIDYGKKFQYPVEFSDDRQVYSPAISPDGKFVAYSSGNEGQSRAAKISIRSLDSSFLPAIQLAADPAYTPRWWINPSSRDTFIVYTNSAIINSDPSWSSTKTFLQKIEGGKPSGDPSTVVEMGGFHDGISNNGRFIITAYNRLMVKDISTDSVRQLFLFPKNGKDSSGSTQVCNASISPDTGTFPRCLFLDFGSKAPSRVAGRSYGIHEILFLMNMKGTIEMALACPADDNSWDFTEWSNHSDFAIASVRNQTGQSYAIRLIDCANKKSEPVLKGVELQQPALWIENSFNPLLAENDSIGAYNDPAVHSTQARFAYRMHFFWQQCDSIEYLFAGSSHSAYAIDPHSFSKHRVHNMAFGQADPATTRAFIYNYALTHCKNLKFVGIDLISGFFNDPRSGDFSFSTGISKSKGYQFDRNWNFWENRLVDVRTSLIARNAPVVGGLDSLNIEKSLCNGWGGNDPGMYGTGGWDTGSNAYKDNVKLWEQFINTLDSLGITLLFFVTPENPVFTAKGFAGRYGPALDVGKEIISVFQDFQRKYKNFHFYDAHDFGNHDYTDNEACDADHLCETGARKFSARLDSILTGLMP